MFPRRQPVSECVPSVELWRRQRPSGEKRAHAQAAGFPRAALLLPGVAQSQPRCGSVRVVIAPAAALAQRAAQGQWGLRQSELPLLPVLEYALK